MTLVQKYGPTLVGDTAVTYKTDGVPLIEEVKVGLHVSKGVDKGASIILPEAGAVVGTGKDVDFRLKDPAVSRTHLKLTPVPDGVWATDLGSTNGTLLNKKKITESLVTVGSVIVIGKTRLEIVRRIEQAPLMLSRRKRFGELIGSSAVMRQVYSLLERAAEVDVTVLLEGETGTGKELAVQALHKNSSRASKNLQIVDCGAVSPTLIEAELFGHVKGSFTGADRDRPGAFELAHGGTLFFDEIGELPSSLQPKLLRAIESREICRVGGTVRTPVDVRFIAATNRNLAEEIKAGRFREDLYYRLNVFKINMPPLREHRDDIPKLIEHFTSAHFADATPLPEDLIAQMSDMDWPGNVRELKNAVERALILEHRSTPSSSFAQSKIKREVGTDSSVIPVDINRPFKELKSEVVAQFERSYLDKILAQTHGNISAAARKAGIDRKHMERLIRKHEINVKAL